MLKLTRRVLVSVMAVATTAAVVFMPAPTLAQSDPIRIAFGDIASVESLNLLIAIERTKERGVPVEITFFNSEDVAAQAVVSGQADIGVGAPYAFIQNSKAPIRMFYRMSTLLFFPVVNSEVYDDWKDLDGQEVAVHSRGSGTEALMRLMEDIHGIQYSNMSYIPGSEVRAGAMLQGTINATIVDAAAWRFLQEEGGGKFKRLSIEGVNATDEALYAGADFLNEREDDVVVLVQELMRTWKEIAENPEVAAELREQYDLLADLPAEVETDVAMFYREAVEGGVFPVEPVTPEDVQDDFEFLAAAGSMKGEPESLDPEDFWDFDPVNRAREAE
jgi:NitT/TauT family transport system substrate-binding protein